MPRHRIEQLDIQIFAAFIIDGKVIAIWDDRIKDGIIPAATSLSALCMASAIPAPLRPDRQSAAIDRVETPQDDADMRNDKKRTGGSSLKRCNAQSHKHAPAADEVTQRKDGKRNKQLRPKGNRFVRQVFLV